MRSEERVGGQHHLRPGRRVARASLRRGAGPVRRGIDRLRPDPGPAGPPAAGTGVGTERTVLPSSTAASRPPASTTGIPLVVSTPTTREPRQGGPAHRMPRPTRKERRARRKERIRRRRTVVGRHPKTTVALVLVLALTPVWVSAGSAATNQALGNTPGARLTEWVRDHGGGGHRHLGREHLVHLARPAQGGQAPPGRHPGARGHHHDHPAGRPGPPPVPAAIVPFVATPTPGEGQWHPVGRTVGGIPAMYTAFLRPNAVNTSLVTGVAWMDTKLLADDAVRGDDHPGHRPDLGQRGPAGRPRPRHAGGRLQLRVPHAGRPGRLLRRRRAPPSPSARCGVAGHRQQRDARTSGRGVPTCP